MSNEPECVPATTDELRCALQRTQEEAEKQLRDKDLRIAELAETARQWAQRYDRLMQEAKEEKDNLRQHWEQYRDLLLKERAERQEERTQHREKESKLEEDLRTAQEQHREEKSRLEAQHRERESRLEAQLAAALGRNERMMQAFQEGVERESRERDDMRDAAERNQRDLAKEWRDRLEAEQERWAAERARLSGRIQQLEARPDALAPAVQQIAALVRRQVAYGTVDRGLELVAQEEAAARAQLQGLWEHFIQVLNDQRRAVAQEEAAGRVTLTTEEAAARRALERQRDESLKQVRARETARIEAVFAARGLSVSELRRTHLGKGPTTDINSNAVGEGLYNLFLALRPGGPVDRFAMRELLRGETDVIHVYYNTQGQESTWYGFNFIIPAADAYELAACVLCHLPSLQYLGFGYLLPLSTRSLEWVSHLPQCMKELSFRYTNYTVADLREMHRRRGGRTFCVSVDSNNCTDWGEFDIFDYGIKQNKVNKRLGEMLDWFM